MRRIPLIWQTARGETYVVQSMTDSHLYNAHGVVCQEIRAKCAQGSYSKLFPETAIAYIYLAEEISLRVVRQKRVPPGEPIVKTFNRNSRTRQYTVFLDERRQLYSTDVQGDISELLRFAWTQVKAPNDFIAHVFLEESLALDPEEPQLLNTFRLAW